MSLSESRDPLAPQHVPLKPETNPPPISGLGQNRLYDKFRVKAEAVMEIEDHHPAEVKKQKALIFEGKLKFPASEIYDDLSKYAERKGYTVYLQRQHGKEQILFAEGILQARNIGAPWWVHLLLLLLTLASTVVAGSLLDGYRWPAIEAALRTIGDKNSQNTLQFVVRSGWQFAVPLLLILGTHEMGHYIAARLHGVKVTLPFFIPLPLFGSLGTLGAIIFIKSPFRNRKMLFDIGIAGPLAGLIVAIPVFIYGLQVDPSIGRPMYWIENAGIDRIHTPIFLETVASFVIPQARVEKLDQSLFYNYPIALAAWFGVFLTSLNLLPLGQFDGGHIAFALFGRRIAWSVATLVAIFGVTIGLLSFVGLNPFGFMWLVWVGMAMLTGLRHPPPHDDITPLGWPRTILGITVFLLFFTMIVITPFYIQPR